MFTHQLMFRYIYTKSIDIISHYNVTLAIFLLFLPLQLIQKKTCCYGSFALKCDDLFENRIYSKNIMISSILDKQVNKNHLINRRYFLLHFINKMIFSPSRRQYETHPYTQLRQQANSYIRRSQRSPQISSPRLNAQSQHHKISYNSVQDLQMKLETVLRHNSHLLNENATLSQMVNSLRIDLVSQNSKEQQLIEDKNREVYMALENMKNNQLLHEKELQKLMNEISALHTQCYQVQVKKDQEIKMLREKYEKDNVSQTALIRKTNQQSKNLMELQIKKLKETIQLRDYEIEAIKAQFKNDTESLNNQINSLVNEIKHVTMLKDIQISQINARNKEKLNSTIKEMEGQRQLQITQYLNTIKKLKKQINQKDIEMQQKKRMLSSQTRQLQSQLHALREEKQKLIEQFDILEAQSFKTLQFEKNRLNELIETQKENLIGIMQSEKQCLKAENSKLHEINQTKTSQIKRLYNALEEEKQTLKKEIKRNQALVQQLRNKIKDIQLSNQEELQLLKIKMGQLHHADIKSMETYFQNQVAAYKVQNRQLNENYTINRDKVYNLLQLNDEQRKSFQIQLSKQKAKVQDLKVRLAAMQAQHKQHITSLGTKMQLTSQTLLREADLKHRGQAFYETEKKKYCQIIDNKDKQIKSLNQTMERIKQLHTQQISDLQKFSAELKQKLADKQNEIKNTKRALEAQFEKRKKQIMNKFQVAPDDEIYEENKQLKKQCSQLQNKLFSREKQIQNFVKENKNLLQQIGLKAGFIETIQLESQAAIQDEKSKMKLLMNENQVSLKTYFEDKLSSRDKDIRVLKDQLSEKQNDIRELIVKYKALQKRLQSLLDAQDKLTQFENKIASMGLDQSLVKNMAQLFSKYKKNK